MSLLDLNSIAQITGNTSSDSRPLGLLSPEAQQFLGGGLLGRFQPGPNEGWSERLFGTNDPRDPRGPAMTALSLGLLRGDFASGVEGANRAIFDTEDRNTKRALNNLALGRSALELQQLGDTMARRSSIRDGLTRLEQGDQGGGINYGSNQRIASGANPLGMPGGGGLPMFSQPVPQGGLSGSGSPTLQKQYEALGGSSAGQGNQVPGNYDSARGNYTQQLSQRLIRQASVYSANGDFETANKLYENASKFMPEVHKIEVMMQGDQPVNVITYKDGRQQVSAFGAKPDVHWMDTGNQVQAVDQNSMRPLGSPFMKQVTPGERASNAVAWANQRTAAERLQLDKEAPQYIQTDQGYVAVPKKPGAGPIVAQPVTGPNGESLASPKALTETQGKATTFAARMQDASRVLNDLEGKVAPNQVAQAGYRAEFPGWMPGGQILGSAVTAANNQFNPAVSSNAQLYRQAQENWVTANLRQESGAAISKDEMEKDVRKWFPQPGDSSALIGQKAAARQVAGRAMLTQAGPGARQVPSVVNGGTPGSEASAPDWKYVNGKLVRVK
jgi:hypothetical protein